MSIEFVGMIFPRQWSETRGVRSPDFDRGLSATTPVPMNRPASTGC